MFRLTVQQKGQAAHHLKQGQKQQISGRACQRCAAAAHLDLGPLLLLAGGFQADLHAVQTDDVSLHQGIDLHRLAVDGDAAAGLTKS